VRGPQQEETRVNLAGLNQQFVDGVWRDGGLGRKLLDLNPYDGSVVAEFAAADVKDIDDAYTAAKRAQSVWDRVNAYRKRTVFERAIRSVEDHAEEITELIIDELGGTPVRLRSTTSVVAGSRSRW
jgi:acyl-CoA reductase-like NAD-dependent aldehyde dehydrogenase